MKRGVVAITAVMVCLSACGSTVGVSSVAGSAAPGLSSDLGIASGSTDTASGQGTSTSPPAAATVSEGSAHGATTSGADANGDASGAPGHFGPSGSSAVGKLPAKSKGVTDAVIRIGFLYLASAGTVVGAFGVQGYSQGNELGEMTALVNDQNAHGGLGGRKLQLVPHDLGGISDSNFQAACDFFTQDNPVYIVTSALAHSDVLNTCLAKRGVGYSSNYLAPFNRSMRSVGPVFAPDDLSGERLSVLGTQAMIDSGLFPKDAKVGIIRQDTPDWDRASKNIIRPRLAAAGIKVVAEETYSATDASATVSGAAGVTFRLRGAGVTHVLILDSPLFYMTAAQSQGWHPFWEITSRAGGGAFLAGSAPKEQLANSGGPGWQRVSDLAEAQSGGYLNAEEKRCLTTLAKAGYSYTGTPKYVAEMLCGELYHLVRVVGRSTELSMHAFQLAAENLPAYLSPMTFSLSFTGGRHDGANGYRIVQYLKSCSCYQYTTPVRTIPSS